MVESYRTLLESSHCYNSLMKSWRSTNSIEWHVGGLRVVNFEYINNLLNILETLNMHLLKIPI